MSDSVSNPSPSDRFPTGGDLLIPRTLNLHECAAALIASLERLDETRRIAEQAMDYSTVIPPAVIDDLCEQTGQFMRDLCRYQMAAVDEASFRDGFREGARDPGRSR